MPLAVIALDFDPVVRLGEWAIRMDTLVAALGVLLALVLAAAIARRMPAKGSDAIAGILRPDDVLFIALAAMPGALIGGRLGYVLLHLEYYAANPTAFVDPAQGSLELALAVVGGALTGGYGARVLSGSAARWFDVAAVPTLAALAVGKLAMAAAGSGQGIPWQGSWATAYVGPGPWGSLAAGFPAHPAQLYEAAAIGMILLVVVAFRAGGLFDRRDGTAFLAAVGTWAAARAAIATLWRDPAVLGPLNVGQLIALAVVVACIVGGIALARRPVAVAVPPSTEPHWPDPETRPRF